MGNADSQEYHLYDIDTIKTFPHIMTLEECKEENDRGGRMDGFMDHLVGEIEYYDNDMEECQWGLPTRKPFKLAARGLVELPPMAKKKKSPKKEWCWYEDSSEDGACELCVTRGLVAAGYPDGTVRLQRLADGVMQIQEGVHAGHASCRFLDVAAEDFWSYGQEYDSDLEYSDPDGLNREWESDSRGDAESYDEDEDED